MTSCRLTMKLPYCQDFVTLFSHIKTMVAFCSSCTHPHHVTNYTNPKKKTFPTCFLITMLYGTSQYVKYETTSNRIVLTFGIGTTYVNLVTIQ